MALVAEIVLPGLGLTSTRAGLTTIRAKGSRDVRDIGLVDLLGYLEFLTNQQ